MLCFFSMIIPTISCFFPVIVVEVLTTFSGNCISNLTRFQRPQIFCYCLKKVTYKEFVNWVCDDCEVKEPGELNTKKSDAISVENRDCTSLRHCKATSKAKVDVPETKLKSCQGRDQQLHQPGAGIDSVENCRIAGDSPVVKMSKKRSNPASLRDEKYEQRLVHCSSEHSHESQTSIECNEQTQSANASPLPAKRLKEEVTGPLAREKLHARHLKEPCEGDIQPGTQDDSSSMIEKTMSMSSRSNHHEEESTIGNERRLTPQTRTVVNGDPSQFSKGEQPNEHGGLDRAQPLIDFIWRGSFNIWNKEYETFYGQAHLSVKACQKVFEEASLLPASLQLEMLPKSDLWPKSFTISEPTDDNIALYFFPSDIRWEKVFDRLVEKMISNELALRAIVTNAELLVFTSTELPLLYWRFQGKHYLWGVFRAKRDSSRNSMMRNGKRESETHPTPGNELAVKDGGDVANAKTWDQSPLSPLSNASLGSATS
ncbi:uncharacterized protein LOC107783956 isoform X2 [Nicotiana tabacum]|uniref:Uncharacterized protein isoform X2 n=2 Tax=Nicotiana tabacum TaxID=4097 RepID=A0A1S3Z8E3_TOBAC|nr:PREDICTED: uncharacterized protein LOC107783956 isoform X2 [Nicotiana tabacum]